MISSTPPSSSSVSPQVVSTKSPAEQSSSNATTIVSVAQQHVWTPVSQPVRRITASAHPPAEQSSSNATAIVSVAEQHVWTPVSQPVRPVTASAPPLSGPAASGSAARDVADPVWRATLNTALSLSGNPSKRMEFFHQKLAQLGASTVERSQLLDRLPTLRDAQRHSIVAALKLDPFTSSDSEANLILMGDRKADALPLIDTIAGWMNDPSTVPANLATAVIGMRTRVAGAFDAKHLAEALIVIGELVGRPDITASTYRHLIGTFLERRGDSGVSKLDNLERKGAAVFRSAAEFYQSIGQLSDDGLALARSSLKTPPPDGLNFSTLKITVGSERADVNGAIVIGRHPSADPEFIVPPVLMYLPFAKAGPVIIEAADYPTLAEKALRYLTGERPSGLPLQQGLRPYQFVSLCTEISSGGEALLSFQDGSPRPFRDSELQRLYLVRDSLIREIGIGETKVYASALAMEQGLQAALMQSSTSGGEELLEAAKLDYPMLKEALDFNAPECVPHKPIPDLDGALKLKQALDLARGHVNDVIDTAPNLRAHVRKALNQKLGIDPQFLFEAGNPDHSLTDWYMSTFTNVTAHGDSTAVFQAVGTCGPFRISGTDVRQLLPATDVAQGYRSELKDFWAYSEPDKPSAFRQLVTARSDAILASAALHQHLGLISKSSLLCVQQVLHLGTAGDSCAYALELPLDEMPNFTLEGAVVFGRSGGHNEPDASGPVVLYVPGTDGCLREFPSRAAMLDAVRRSMAVPGSPLLSSASTAIRNNVIAALHDPAGAPLRLASFSDEALDVSVMGQLSSLNSILQNKLQEAGPVAAQTALDHLAVAEHPLLDQRINFQVLAGFLEQQRAETPDWYSNGSAAVRQEFERLQTNANKSEALMSGRLNRPVPQPQLLELLHKSLEAIGFGELDPASIIIRIPDVDIPGPIAYTHLGVAASLLSQLTRHTSVGRWREVSLLELAKQNVGFLSATQIALAEVYVRRPSGELSVHMKLQAYQLKAIADDLKFGTNHRRDILAAHFAAGFLRDSYKGFETMRQYGAPVDGAPGSEILRHELLRPLRPAAEIVEWYQSKAKQDLFITMQQDPVFSPASQALFEDSISGQSSVERRSVSMGNHAVGNIHIFKRPERPGVIMHFASDPPSGCPIRDFENLDQAMSFLETRARDSEAWNAYLAENADPEHAEALGRALRFPSTAGQLFHSHEYSWPTAKQIAVTRVFSAVRQSVEFAASQTGVGLIKQDSLESAIKASLLRMVPIYGTYLLANDFAKEVVATVAAYQADEVRTGIGHLFNSVQTLADLGTSVIPLKGGVSSLGATLTSSRRLVYKAINQAVSRDLAISTRAFLSGSDKALSKLMGQLTPANSAARRSLERAQHRLLAPYRLDVVGTPPHYAGFKAGNQGHFRQGSDTYRVGSASVDGRLTIEHPSGRKSAALEASIDERGRLVIHGETRPQKLPATGLEVPDGMQRITLDGEQLVVYKSANFRGYHELYSEAGGSGGALQPLGLWVSRDATTGHYQRVGLRGGGITWSSTPTPTPTAPVASTAVPAVSTSALTAATRLAAPARLNRIEILTSKGPLTGKQRQNDSSVVDIFNSRSQIIGTYKRPVHGDIWKPLESSAKAPAHTRAASEQINLQIKAARNAVDKVDEIVSKALRQKSDPAFTPNDIETALQGHVRVLDQHAATLVTALEGVAPGPRETTLRGVLGNVRLASRQLAEQAYDIRLNMIMSRSPTADGLEWLWLNKQLEFPKTITRKPASRLHANDFFDEYKLTVRGQPAPWAYAHFHYKSPNAPVLDISAGHLKLPSQRLMGQQAQSTALAAGQKLDIHRNPLSKFFAQSLDSGVDGVPIRTAAAGHAKL